MGKLIPGSYLHSRLEVGPHLGTRLCKMEENRTREKHTPSEQVASAMLGKLIFRRLPSQIEFVREYMLNTVCTLAWR